ncbi:MAG TPA: peptidoglycan DD-metalloendopeptidase family protein [Gaiella sp.]|nr:peptidoglycan DD-metalloendopeptidase family protein [Gaiella sp.]
MGRPHGLPAAAAALLLAVALLATGTAAGDPGADKARVDSELERLRGRAADADRQAGVLTEELSAVAGRVRELQSGVAAQQARLSVLEGELASAQARLASLDRTIVAQTKRLERLRAEYGVALARLERRVRELYMTDGPDVLSFVLGTSSFTDILDNLELLGRIGRQDERIASRVKRSRDGVADARRRTRVARAEQARVEAAAEAATVEQRGVVTRLVASRDALVAARRDKSATLASIEASETEIHEEIEGLEAQSAALAEQIRQAQQNASASSGAPAIVPSTGSGALGWPVSGPVVSGFGMRWGRMHEGIDITCPTGTPVRAAGAGTVIWAGWRGGYGNLVVVDHGGGLSTAYAHNSSFASSVGQPVARGELIAYAGSTGNSSGPHVHFEVRVNGSAVDPLGYL